MGEEADVEPSGATYLTWRPGKVSSRLRVAAPAWSNNFANCSLCFWLGRLRATRCGYVHSSVSGFRGENLVVVTSDLGDRNR